MKAVARVLYICLLSFVLACTLANAPAFGQSNVSGNEGCPIGGYTVINCPVVNDRIIARAIQMRLSGYMEPGNNNVVINVNKGIVTFSGNVATEDQRSAATIAASETRGVVRIINNIMVSCSIAGSDLAILAAVKSALDRSPYDVLNVQVYIIDGVISLRGFTIDEFNRTQIGLLAGSIKGVTAVHDDIFLSGSPLTQ